MSSRKYLAELEAESIHIIREVTAETENPVLLYSIGKDSSVLLHLLKKSFYPNPPPLNALHVDTTWKFSEMYLFRDRAIKNANMKLIVHQNPDAMVQGINPFDHGTLHTDMWKTQGLKQAISKYRFDAAFGGARRDEEKSRAKERILSFRSNNHAWDPQSQRPELWSLYNTNKNKNETFRVFPLSNWTEIDIWHYIEQEEIDLVPLYFAKKRPVVKRDGSFFMVDDKRFPLNKNESPEYLSVRFRTLGCYPLTAAEVSEARTLKEVIYETERSKTSERSGRKIDSETNSSMEEKKRQGYF